MSASIANGYRKRVLELVEAAMYDEEGLTTEECIKLFTGIRDELSVLIDQLSEEPARKEKR